MPDMNEHELKRRFKAIAAFETNPDQAARDLEQVRQLLTKQHPKRTPLLWSIIMYNKLTKLTTAAMILFAALLSIQLLDPNSVAHALEEAIKASHSIRQIHIKVYELDHELPKQFWVEFKENGQVDRMRGDFPAWVDDGDGPKITVWKDNVSDIWYKEKKLLKRLPDQNTAQEMQQRMELFDPKTILARLHSMRDYEFLTIDMHEPSSKTEPLVITTTVSMESQAWPGKRSVVYINQSTHLMTHLEHYQFNGQTYEYEGTIEFYNYNQPFDPAMFNLDEATSDLTRIDYTTQTIGLLQGKLSDKEIATKAVREFYQALIDKDYAKAGQIYCGLPADKMKQYWKDIKVLRIISISDPIPYPKPRVGGFMVHCEIEIEKDGVVSIKKPYGPAVRPVFSQPHCWNIHGGVK